MEITTIGLDLAKNVFQVHGINSASEVVVKKTLRRVQMRRFFEQLDPCLVGIEACGTSHRWAREITRLGHEVRLMPPAYVKPYVKRGKTDASDAEAICEAVTRPTMRYVAIKSPEQQAALAQAAQSVVATTAIDHLNFGYSVKPVNSRKGPRWQPLRVFDDGLKTYIQFPANLASSEAPPVPRAMKSSRNGVSS